ncbi:MAG: glycoside hydrolase family 28 protein [Christensenellales bacterium]|jgi:hypothetical protein
MKEYLITDFGAREDNHDCAPAINAAIESAFLAGGGLVRVAPGTWNSGTIELKSNVELHLMAGAVLKCLLNEEAIKGFADEEAASALKVGFFVGAANADNVTISGGGEIYGQGEKTMIDDHSDGGFDESPFGIAEFRPKLSVFYNCENLTVRDVTIREAASWTLHLCGCRHVRVDGIKIINTDRGANNDGIDPDCCRDVKITNCHVETGDDAIVVKSTKAMTERFGSCRDILINNCTLHSRDSALKIGTETHDDIENVLFSNCIAYDCSRILGIWARDGATISNIRATNIIGSTRHYASSNRGYPNHWWGRGEPVFISAAPRNEQSPRPGKIRDIYIDGLKAKCESSLFISGETGCEVENIFINNVDLDFVRQGTQPTGLFDEQPSIRDFRRHDIPAVYLSRAKKVFAQNLRVNFTDGEKEKWTGVLEAENCRELDFDRVRGNVAKEGLPAAVIRGCEEVHMTDWRVDGALGQGSELE